MANIIKSIALKYRVYKLRKKFLKSIEKETKKYKSDIENDIIMSKNAEVTDLAQSHRDSMLNHSNKYTALLGNYTVNSYYTLKQKRRFKEIFFWISVLTLVLSLAMFIGICYMAIKAKGIIQTNLLATLIASAVSLLTLYMIIPKIIAKYLFNIKEDENMTKIIESIQKYDAEVEKHLGTVNKNADNKNNGAA